MLSQGCQGWSLLYHHSSESIPIGFIGSGPAHTNKVSFFDPDTFTWAFSPHTYAFPNVRQNAWVGISDTEAFIMGGITSTHIKKKELYYFNESTGFTRKSDMPTAKYRFAGGYFKHPNGTRFIITVGGKASRTSFLQETALYNIEEDYWHTNPGMNYPGFGRTFTQMMGFLHKSRFYVVGSTDTADALGSVGNEIYAFMFQGPDDFTWTKIDEFDMKNPRFCGSFTAILPYH